MSSQPVEFVLYPGVYGDPFPGVSATLEGSWDKKGEYSDSWSTVNMKKVASSDGGICYRSTVLIDESQSGIAFFWGVTFHDQDTGTSTWAIPAEINSVESHDRHRTFYFDGTPLTESYYLTHCRLLGANKVRTPDGTWRTCFRVWAPNAKKVELVFGFIWDINDPNKKPGSSDNPLLREKIAGGYITNDHIGIHPDDEHFPTIPLIQGDGGIWETPKGHNALQSLDMMNHRLYMYRITLNDEEESIVYRTDLFSRCQVGHGWKDPNVAENDSNISPWNNLLSELAGGVSCSVSVDPEKVVKKFDIPQWPEPDDCYVSVEEFWADEFTDKALPERVEDLIIYELHLGALGFGSEKPGTLKDAIALLDHLCGLNINAIELLPLSEFAGGADNWGYATSHYFAIEYGGGGRDEFKHFVKECHRRGLIVIMDVVYNHYDHHADRAQRYYDSTDKQHDIYYWYEGHPSDYEQLKYSDWGNSWSRGGYPQNDSTGDAPAYHEAMVRKMFISSAIALVEEFHVDGFRVDQTTSIHLYNKVPVSAIGDKTTWRPASHANIFGGKFLREFGRTMRLFRPNIILIAEDHSSNPEITCPVERGGMGFDARWYSDYYHHLSGDTMSGDKSKLLLNAARSNSEAPLNMDWFADALMGTQYHKIVYNESHDEAGNSEGPFYDKTWEERDEEHKRNTSERTINVAVDSAPLFGDTRKYAEARCRFAWGVTVLSAGTPMFLFGEEVGAEKRFKYKNVTKNKEDLHRMREGSGKNLYKFYSEVNALRLRSSALRSQNIAILHKHNDNRVIVFRRWNDKESYLVFACMADRPFANGYVVEHSFIEAGDWTEVFNSDSSSYGGYNVGNAGQAISSINGRIKAVIPFAGFVVLAHERNSN